MLVEIIVVEQRRETKLQKTNERSKVRATVSHRMQVSGLNTLSSYLLHVALSYYNIQ